MLHVSDLMREMKCDCFCWNSAHNSLHQESFYKMDCPFSDLWRNYLNANECGLGHSMDSNEQSLKLLEGLIDIYLPDLKYYDDWYSIKYSKAPNYFNIAIDAIEEMYRQVGNVVYDKNGIMKKGIIVRHLMLPGRGDDSKKIIEYLHLTYRNNIFISIMNQYTPLKQVKEIDELNKKVSDEEYSKLINYACDIGVEKAFIQEGDTCSESFIPEFDLTGVK